MYACMTPVGFDTSDKFENHWFRPFSIVGPLQFSITNDFTLLWDIHDEQHIHKTLRTSACAERLARKLRILFLKSLV